MIEQSDWRDKLDSPEICPKCMMPVLNTPDGKCIGCMRDKLCVKRRRKTKTAGFKRKVRHAN